jgi:hypothetical protein
MLLLTVPARTSNSAEETQPDRNLLRTDEG